MSPQCPAKIQRNRETKKDKTPKRKKITAIPNKNAKLSRKYFCVSYQSTIFVYNFGVLMTEEDKRLINTFEGKLRHLMFLYDELKKENVSLRQLLSQKEAELARLENSRKELEEQYTNLKMARIISINDNELRDTKQRLARLVREVDKCIALLNE